MKIDKSNINKNFVNIQLNDNNLKEYDYMIIKYENNNEIIKLFGSKFIENNIEKAYINIENNYYKLKEYHNFYTNEKDVEIKLIFIENEIDMSYMFNNINYLKEINGRNQQ